MDEFTTIFRQLEKNKLINLGNHSSKKRKDTLK